MVQQTPTQWDLSGVDRYSAPDEKLFVLALFVVFLTVTLKLVRIWLLAPPFRRALPSNPTKYRKRLELSVRSLAQWLWLPVFFCFFLCTHRLSALFAGIESIKIFPVSSTMDELKELTTYFSYALSVTAYAFLIRWNLLLRLTKLRD